MKIYKCPRCGHMANQKNDLRKHFLRKNYCQVKLQNISIADCIRIILNGKNEIDCGLTAKTSKIDCEMTANDCELTAKSNFDCEMTAKKFSCIYCKKMFTRKNNRNVHVQKTCREKNKICFETDLEKDKIIENLKTENEILKNSKNTTIQNNMINNTVIINAFGKENLKYVSKEYIHGLIREGPYGSIRKLIKYIHFNPDHKENHNIKIPNKRDKYAMVYDGSTWQIKNKKNMITTIADHAYGVIAEHCEDIISKKLDRFRDDFESEESQYMKRLAEDTELIILNGQNEIGLI